MRHVLMLSLLALAVLPLAVPEVEGRRCVTTSWPTAREIDTSDNTYYLRQYQYSSGSTFVEIWQESNGIAGLQPDDLWACGGGADTLVEQVCQGGRECPGGFNVVNNAPLA